MNVRLARAGLVSLGLALLLSCGGGSGDGSTGAPGGVQSADAAGAGSTTAGGSGGGTGASADGGSAGGTDSPSTASAGGEDSGVGSGGTGVSTADASTSVGAVDGFGSVIVDGLRYDVEQASVDLRDDTTLKIGMSIAVTGPVDADFANGTARQLSSAAELRGPVSTVDVAAGSFVVLGSTVSVDDETVWGDLPGLSGLLAGPTTVQVWGLPTASGALRATRVETRGAGSTPIVAGVVSQLDRSTSSFMLGSLRVSYTSAAFEQGLTSAGLANGMIVRVRSDQQPSAGRLALQAASIAPWYSIPVQAGVAVQLEGVISEFSSQGAFRVLGTKVDASAAKVTGAQAGKLYNGVKVIASGTLSANGTLVASKLKIRHIPGAGVLPSHSVSGNVTNYQSLADFQVHGQKVDARGAKVIAGTGTLANGVKVTVQGAQIINDVLIATELSFN